MTDIRNRGFKTKAELDEHLADAEDAAAAEEVAAAPLDYAVQDQEAAELAGLQADIASLRDELALVRARLAVVREQAKTVVSERARWADASAHEQLGDHPWLKLAGAMTLTFFAARALRGLPLSAMATAAMPLALSRFDRRR